MRGRSPNALVSYVLVPLRGPLYPHPKALDPAS
jgi:hypothetical protein